MKIGRRIAWGVSLALGCLVLLGGGQTVVAQEGGASGIKQLTPVAGIASNQVQVLEAAGDSLWSGPLLTLFLENEDRSGADSLFSAQVPALTEEGSVVFAIAAENADSRSLVWAGLAFDTGGGTPGTGGFLVSTDGGHTFMPRAAALDAPTDTSVQYGGTTLPAFPVTRESNSAPQSFAFGPARDTVWVAGNRSGLRWTTDQGRSWTRAVLPPDTSATVAPGTAASFPVGPPQENGVGFNNHVVLSVLVDETGTVWAGTANGINRSVPGSATTGGQRAWRHVRADGTPDTPTGNAVVAVAEQPRSSGRNPIWMASWAVGQAPASAQRFGVTVTRDGGTTYRQALVGERIYDLAAREGRVYAAGESGLFVSGDGGDTWRSITAVQLRSPDREPPSSLSARAVEVTPSALWLGTTEGLLRLDRAQEGRLLPTASSAPPPRWQLFRTNVPVNPEDPSEQVPDVSTFAYPNPFAPAQDGSTRIVYNVDSPQSVTITIYDFGMNRVRTIEEEARASGRQETTWDGMGQGGLRLPTGPYLYTVEAGGRTLRGKIVLTN
jgi:hypothetical protein